MKNMVESVLVSASFNFVIACSAFFPRKAEKSIDANAYLDLGLKFEAATKAQLEAKTAKSGSLIKLSLGNRAKSNPNTVSKDARKVANF